MSNTREIRKFQDSVHLFLALKREGSAKDKMCIRTIIKDEALDLKILESKLLLLGGKWRIHKTVNARDCEKARKILLKFLIDNPDHASTIDSEWRTALLQKECKTTKYFMLDVDTKEQDKIHVLNDILWAEFRKTSSVELYLYRRYDDDNNLILKQFESPKGYHIITVPFDTREVCKLPYVTLLRDGYYFVKEVGTNENPT